MYDGVCDGFFHSLQWRHNEHDGVSNHRRFDYLLNRLFSRRKETTKKHQGFASLAFVTGEFSAQMSSNAENVFYFWKITNYASGENNERDYSKLNSMSENKMVLYENTTLHARMSQLDWDRFQKGKLSIDEIFIFNGKIVFWITVPIIIAE